MKFGALLALLSLAACAGPAGRPSQSSLPDSAYYSQRGVAAARLGVMGASLGAHILSGSHTALTMLAGQAAAAGGALLIAYAMVDAIEVERERERLYYMYSYLHRQGQGIRPVENPFRAPPRIEELPFDPSETPLILEEGSP